MITLFSNKCPRCKILKSKLDTNGIEYVEVNDNEIMLSRGFSTVPMLEVDGKIMDFSQAIEWINERNN